MYGDGRSGGLGKGKVEIKLDRGVGSWEPVRPQLFYTDEMKYFFN